MEYDREIEWFCPRCETNNVNIPAATHFPMCSHCNTVYEWWELQGENFAATEGEACDKS
jgi:hypothetical protein